MESSKSSTSELPSWLKPMRGNTSWKFGGDLIDQRTRNGAGHREIHVARAGAGMDCGWARDIFSLGSVIYELSRGNRISGATTSDVIAKF